MKQGSSFFIAFRVLPPERRRAIETVYAFCRRADDAVDDAPDAATASRNLAQVEAEVRAAFDARPAGTKGSLPDADALRSTVARYRLPREPFDLLLEGQRWDLEGRTYETTADLREYCKRVASSVGRLCVRIFGGADGVCDPYADELGVALQWTNILRDLGSDLARGRVYLPRTALQLHDLSAAELMRHREGTRAKVAALVRAEAAYARACFAAAERLLPPAERARMLSGRIMGAVYEQILERIEWAGASVLDRRIRLSTFARAATALRVVAGERARNWVGAGS